eukprot:gene32727-42079_t
MANISDTDQDVRRTAHTANQLFVTRVRGGSLAFDLSSLLAACTAELSSDHTVTRVTSLEWIFLLQDVRAADVSAGMADLLPLLLSALSDSADEVVLATLQVLWGSPVTDKMANIPHPSTSPHPRGGLGLTDAVCLDVPCQVLARAALDEEQFQAVFTSLVAIFRSSRPLLEARGALIIRKLCALLDSEKIYLQLAEVILEGCEGDLDFASLFVQTLNLLLLTAPELSPLRSLLKSCGGGEQRRERERGVGTGFGSAIGGVDQGGGGDVDGRLAKANVTFRLLFRAWSHNPVATFSLC